MQEIFNLINEMSPYLLLGFGIAGLMHTFVPSHLYNRFLSKRGVRSVFYAAALGVPIPLCSCGVLPTAMSLRREGASKGATTSFLIATPQTGIDSIMATYSLMGFPFAILRPIAALVTALLGGILVDAFDRNNGEGVDNVEAEPLSTTPKYTTMKDKLCGALKYGYVDMMQDIGKWLVAGLLVAGIITLGVPEDFFAQFADRPLVGMLLVLICAVPMYLCATGSIPIAVALMLKGVTPGAALVLLMAGPAVNVASVLVIRKVLGNRTLWLYLAAIVGGAFAFALCIDHLLPREWFTSALSTISTSCHTNTSWFHILCTIILSILLLYGIWRRYYHTNTHQCSCNGQCTDSCEDACHDIVTNYRVGGMHCNHCRASVLRVVGKLPGVENVDVDLQSGAMTVTGNTAPSVVINAVEALGFTIVQE